MKVKVHVLYPTGEKIFTRKTSRAAEVETVVMRKESQRKKDDGWQFELSPNALIYHKGIFRSFHHVFVHPEAPKPIPRTKELAAAEIPMWDKKTSTKFVRKKILDRRGEEPKEKSSNGFVFLAILIIAGIVIQILISSGRIRIG